jgi:hypothetical protein
MMKRLICGLGALALTLCIIGSAQAAPINVNIYQFANDNFPGMTFGPFVGSFTSSDIQFGTNNAWAWDPFNLGSTTDQFGADITGELSVAATGIYDIQTVSDDGSYMYIDGNLVVNNGGLHGPNAADGLVFLTAGNHSFDVQYLEIFWPEAGMDVNLPQGITYTTPEPSSLALVGFGIASLVGFIRKRGASL